MYTTDASDHERVALYIYVLYIDSEDDDQKQGALVTTRDCLRNGTDDRIMDDVHFQEDNEWMELVRVLAALRKASPDVNDWYNVYGAGGTITHVRVVCFTSLPKKRKSDLFGIRQCRRSDEYVIYPKVSVHLLPRKVEGYRIKAFLKPNFGTDCGYEWKPCCIVERAVGVPNWDVCLHQDQLSDVETVLSALHVSKLFAHYPAVMDIADNVESLVVECETLNNIGELNRETRDFIDTALAASPFNTSLERLKNMCKC
jgi:hypothetical protein